jgi:hypothetical protein
VRFAAPKNGSQKKRHGLACAQHNTSEKPLENRFKKLSAWRENAAFSELLSELLVPSQSFALPITQSQSFALPITQSQSFAFPITQSQSFALPITQ